jgi:hypothetical protein
MALSIPNPPDNVRLSPVPNKTVEQAVQWFRAELELNITPRFIRRATSEGKLRCHILARRRMYSTADLYAFVVTRPTVSPARGAA